MCTSLRTKVPVRLCVIQHGRACTHTAHTNCSCFLGLVQVDGTEVTCQVAASQTSVACDVGYPALKPEQQVQAAFQLKPSPAPRRQR